MNIFTLPELLVAHERAGKLYHEFLRVPSLSVGLYQLATGATDPQQPHTEDEVYYIVQGQAQLQIGEENIPVQAGSIAFVAANVDHRFHSITEDLSIIVFFAPAEYGPLSMNGTKNNAKR